MKTSEFIKMLQEADPSGEAHVRMYGGVPKFAELKPGYWDGPYSYIDEEGNCYIALPNALAKLFPRYSELQKLKSAQESKLKLKAVRTKSKIAMAWRVFQKLLVK